MIDYRLPTNIVPESYRLRLRPDIYQDNPEKFNFSGDVTIIVGVKESTPKITLNYKYIEIPQPDIIIEDIITRQRIEVLSTEYEEDRYFFHINLKEDLQESRRYNLTMSFSGRILDDLVGIYYSSYTDEAGETE